MIKYVPSRCASTAPRCNLTDQESELQPYFAMPNLSLHRVLMDIVMYLCLVLSRNVDKCSSYFFIVCL